MSRADLLGLSVEALTSLSNAGLVKRSIKELERGEAPTVEEDARGTVHGRFADGVVTSLPLNASLKQATCSCGAAGVCRHRLATVLAFQRLAATEAPAVPAEPWDPGALTDEALQTLVGEVTFAAAKREADAGLLATVSPGVVPGVALPSCTVRFLVKGDATWARCDCAQQQACVHVPLAVWACRAGAAGVVSLGAVGEAVEVEPLQRLALEVVTTGLSAFAPAAARFALLRDAARREGYVWLETLLEDLEQALDGWRVHSARFTTASVARLVAELWARCRAATASAAALPVAYVVGHDATRETLLDHVRLLSLGCRLQRDGATTFAEVFTVDPDTQEVLVLRRRLDDVTDVGAALARRTIAAKVQLGALACGQLISKVVTRHANRLATLSSSRAVATSVSPQNGDWSMLRAPLRVTDVEAWARSQAEAPPAFLRPRLVAESLRVVEIARVLEVVSVAAEQAVVAVLEDLSGHRLEAVVRHRAVAPNALMAAARAFSGPVRFVSGELTLSARSPSLEVLAISSGTIVEVPDLAEPGNAAPLAPAGQRPEGPLAGVLRSTASALEEALVHGLRTPAPLKPVATNASEHGLQHLAALLDQSAVGADASSRASAWLNAAVVHALLLDERD